jgi:hypothetical protein
VLYDHTGDASRRMGLRDATVVHYLIRPDGYVGYRGEGNDLAGVHAYLEDQLGN